MKKVQYIKFIDHDMDGCGTNLTIMAKVTGELITNGTVERVKNAIGDYQTENEGEWDTDGCLDAAKEQLEAEGYKVEFIAESACITF